MNSDSSDDNVSVSVATVITSNRSRPHDMCGRPPSRVPNDASATLEETEAAAADDDSDVPSETTPDRDRADIPAEVANSASEEPSSELTTDTRLTLQEARQRHDQELAQERHMLAQANQRIREMEQELAEERQRRQEIEREMAQARQRRLNREIEPLRNQEQVAAQEGESVQEVAFPQETDPLLLRMPASVSDPNTEEENESHSRDCCKLC